MGDLTDSNTNAFPYGMGDRMGMSLRDYFAGQALAGLTASKWFMEAPDRERVPELAFAIADTMLKERSKK